MPDPLRRLIGKRERGEPANELQHLYVCKACQQPVDMRDLAAVFHHEQAGHAPLPAEEAFRLLSVEARTALNAKGPTCAGPITGRRP